VIRKVRDEIRKEDEAARKAQPPHGKRALSRLGCCT
jgi:hypothetical protein